MWCVCTVVRVHAVLVGVQVATLLINGLVWDLASKSWRAAACLAAVIAGATAYQHVSTAAETEAGHVEVSP